MKKLYIFSVVLFSLLNAVAAEAKDGAYVGADLNYSNTRHKYSNRNSGSVGVAEVRHGNNIGVGLNGGYKQSLNDKVFVAPEVFYDYMNNTSKDFFYSNVNSKQSTMEVDSRYGAKVNLGYNFDSKFSGFVNLGLAKVRYVSRHPALGVSSATNKLAPIYGIGLAYALTDDWAVRTSYDYQKFNATYQRASYRDTVTLNTLKVGAIYSF